MKRYFSKVNENDISTRRALFGDSSGVYILRCGSEGNWRSVSRICGEDNDGVLYIGLSNELRGGRASDLKKSLSLTAPIDSHSAGERYRENITMQSLYPYEELCLELIATDSQQAAGSLEGELLKQYIKRFGELPPLNRTQ